MTPPATVSQLVACLGQDADLWALSEEAVSAAAGVSVLQVVHGLLLTLPDTLRYILTLRRCIPTYISRLLRLHDNEADTRDVCLPLTFQPPLQQSFSLVLSSSCSLLLLGLLVFGYSGGISHSCHEFLQPLHYSCPHASPSCLIQLHHALHSIR